MLKAALFLCLKEFLETTVLEGVTHNERMVMNFHLHVSETMIVYFQFIHVPSRKSRVHIVNHALIPSVQKYVNVARLPQHAKFPAINRSIPLPFHNVGPEPGHAKFRLKSHAPSVNQLITLLNPDSIRYPL